jgi:hypothetical protein
MVKAIARAFRWRDMLESGTYATIAEIAAAEKINATCWPLAATNAASAGYCRGDSGWAAAGGAAARGPTATVSSGMGGTEIGTFAIPLEQCKKLTIRSASVGLQIPA